MKEDYFFFEVSSPHDLENLMGEAWISDKQFADITLEESEPIIKIYSNSDKDSNSWIIEYKIMKEIIAKMDEFLESVG